MNQHFVGGVCCCCWLLKLQQQHFVSLLIIDGWSVEVVSAS